MVDLGTLQTPVGPLHIRRAGKRDRDALYALKRESATWLNALGYPQPSWLLTDEGYAYTRTLVETREVYIAWLDKEAAATLWLCWEDPRSWGERGLDKQAGYVHGFAVARRLAGHGIGRALLAWAEDRIAKAGKRFARLDCDAQNPVICGYYANLGYRNCGVIEILGVPHRLYEKPLTPAR